MPVIANHVMRYFLPLVSFRSRFFLCRLSSFQELCLFLVLLFFLPDRLCLLSIAAPPANSCLHSCSSMFIARVCVSFLPSFVLPSFQFRSAMSFLVSASFLLHPLPPLLHIASFPVFLLVVRDFFPVCGLLLTIAAKQAL